MATMMAYDLEVTVKVDTATIFATEAEWKLFKATSEGNFRKEAAELAAMAKEMSTHPEKFVYISRPPDGRASRQIKTVDAMPYLEIIYKHLVAHGRHIPIAHIVESLIRGLSVR